MAELKWDKLTSRELEVAELLARGYSRAEIADQLGVSVKTFDTHRGHLLKKLKLRDEVALTRHMIREDPAVGAQENDAPGCMRPAD